MIKLLIADDEPLVLVGLKSMINWDEFGISICGTARNGEQALEIIEKERPQLVIADIKMPLKNGFEVMEECRQKFNPGPLFIILTSFEEREFLRKAITLSAIEYLIKVELTPQSLSEAVSKALKILSEQNRDEKKSKESSDDAKPFYDKFLIRLLNGLFENEDFFKKQKEELEIDLHWPYYRACYCEMSGKTEDTDKRTQLSIYNSSLQMVQETVGRFCPCHAVSLDLRHFALILCFDTLEKAKNDAKPVIERTGALIHNYFSVTLSAACGAITDKAFTIGSSFYSARAAFRQKNSQLYTYCNTFTWTDQKKESIFDLSIYKTNFAKAFEELNTEALNDTISQISDCIELKADMEIQAMDCACMILYMALSFLPEGEEILSEIFADEQDGYRSLYRKRTTPQILQWLEKFRAGICQAIQNKKQNYKTGQIIKIRQYIEANINKKLTLNETAGLFGISPNYLGQQFMKHTNCSFNEYVNRAKIEEAKKLLRQNDLKIYEISDRLGFESSFYFSKVFKKQCGISPRDWADSILNK